MLCDEFGRLALVHASLAETRLVTTPTLLLAFTCGDRIDADIALALLDAIGKTWSFEMNAYVERVRTTLERVE